MKPGAGEKFPKIEVARLGGGQLALGRPAAEGCDWQMVVVYRGLHCPLCRKYLNRLEPMVEAFAAIGIDIVTLSGDPEDKAARAADDWGVSLPMGYGLSVDQMCALGLYVSDPRSPAETDRPFPEPGLFVVNGEGRLQLVDISNAPFARPDLEALLAGLRFVRDKDYPIRGTHTA